MKRKIENLGKTMKTSIDRCKTDMEAQLSSVNNEVKRMKTAFVERFDQIKDVLVKMEDRIKENTRKIRNTPSDHKETIFVAGEAGTGSVALFNWSQKSWAPLQSMSENRFGATAFVHSNHVVTAGGYCIGTGYVDSMIRMKIDPNPDLSTQWSDCPFKLPAKMAYHSSVVHNDHLYVTGGCINSEDQVSDRIVEVQLVRPYTIKTLSRMPEPRLGHGMEIFDDSLVIVGGSTTENYEDNLSSVVLYDIKKKECKHLAPLSYEVSDMATVRWGDNIVVIGGADKDGNALDTVIMYNVMTGQSHMLPPMRCKRWGCTAVVIENSIVVLGGTDEERNDLKSVEAFNFERYHWEELPEMSETRWLHTAVVM